MISQQSFTDSLAGDSNVMGRGTSVLGKRNMEVESGGAQVAFSLLPVLCRCKSCRGQRYTTVQTS